MWPSATGRLQYLVSNFLLDFNFISALFGCKYYSLSERAEREQIMCHPSLMVDDLNLNWALYKLESIDHNFSSTFPRKIHKNEIAASKQFTILSLSMTILNLPFQFTKRVVTSPIWVFHSQLIKVCSTERSLITRFTESYQKIKIWSQNETKDTNFKFDHKVASICSCSLSFSSPVPLWTWNQFRLVFGEKN